jgi:hypothetical protein
MTTIFEHQWTSDAHRARVLDTADGDDHDPTDAQEADVVAVRTTFEDLERHGASDTHRQAALDDGSDGDQKPHDAQGGFVAADPSTIALRLAADTLLDVERLRISTENRIRALSDIDGWATTPAALRWDAHLAALQDLEKQVTRELEHAMKQHPLGPFVKRTVGLGLKQAGRLIGALGDPSWNALEDRPRRGPAELWAFCGYAPGQKRRKGVRDNWNAEAKMRAHLVAESCIKQVGRSEGAINTASPCWSARPRSPYRDVYDAARANWQGREVRDAHAHAHGLRLVAKAVLRDLWIESMRLRREET